MDDSGLNRKIVRRVLEGKFDIIDEAENGLQAVNMCTDACHRGCPYQLIMMDSHMPIMSGLEAARCIKSHQSSIRIVGVTGNTCKADIDSFLEAGVDKVMLKPLNLEEFFDFLLYANVAGTNDQECTGY